MKKITTFLILTAIIFNVNNIISQTIIPNSAFVSGVWDISGSPYIVQGEAIVADYDTLIIKPGVEVRFKTGTDFDYNGGVDCGFLWIKQYGTIQAIGKPDSLIVFTRDDTVGNWGIIFLYNYRRFSTLKYCKIEYANKIVNIGSTNCDGAISIRGWTGYRDNISIINCFINQNNCNGIYIRNSDPLLVGNIISNNENGICCDGADAIITNNTIIKNQCGIRTNYTSDPIIKNTIIYNNTNSSVCSVSLNENPTIENSLLQERNMPGILIDNGNNILNHSPHIDTSNLLLELFSNSPAINAGTNDTTGLNLPEYDILGNTRVHLGRVDIGASEYLGSNYLNVISPNNYEGSISNTNYNIKWNSNINYVKLECTYDNGANWIILEPSIPNNGTYNWPVPEMDAEFCKIKISDINNILMDTCDNFFYIIHHIIPDNCYLSGSLVSENSPYFVNGEVIVPKDSTLIIEPGVELKLETGSQKSLKQKNGIGKIYVEGNIISIGTASDSIKFTRKGTIGNWGSIYISSLSTQMNYFEFTTIEFGGASGEKGSGKDISGALYVMKANLFINNCLIKHNLNCGLQLYIRYGMEREISIVENTIHHNADGIILEGFGITDTIIKYNNIYSNNGYGIHYSWSNPTFQGGVIFHNFINDNENGGIYLSAAANIIHNIITNNNANGIEMVAAEQVQCENNIIKNNNGIGIKLNISSAEISNNWIENNNNSGVFLDNAVSSTEVKNNLIFSNGGHGIKSRLTDPVYYNNTIAFNSGSGLDPYNSSVPTVKNCIIWGNAIDVTSDDLIKSSNSLFNTSSIPSSIIDFGGNIFGQYPQFTDTLINDFTLQFTSPCIDAGSLDVSFLDSLDLAGNQRLSHGRVDMGAYEYQQTGDWLHVVTPNGKEFFESGTNDTIKWICSNPGSQVKIEYTIDEGNTWDLIANSTPNDGEYLWQSIPDVITCIAKIRISDISDPLIADTTDGYFFIVPNLIKDEELVSGTWALANSPYFIEKRAIVPQGQTLVIEPGVEVKFRTGRNIEFNQPYFDVGVLMVEGKLIAEGTKSNPIVFTRLCNDGLWGIVFFNTTSDTTSLLKHCNLEFANAVYTNDLYFGGISFRDASASVENCSFTNCFAGVVSAYGSSPTLIDNTFSLNYEGGVLCWQSSGTKIINNLFYGNLGYGIRCYQSSPAITNNTITFDGSQQLKAIHNRNYILESEMLFKPDNKNYLYGLYIESNSNPVIQNSIIFGNGIYEEGENIYISNSSPEISFSLLSDEVLPTGAINAGYNLLNMDPKFIGTGPQPFSLKETSPCINTGNPDTTGLNLPELDLAGNLRIYENHVVDMGAYEAQVGQKIDLDIKVFLEGPYSSSTMGTLLNTGGYLPKHQPYYSTPWMHPGIDSVQTVPNTDVVDWVLVEMRNSETGPSGAATDKRSGIQVAFLDRDGNVVDSSGNNYLNMLVLDTNNLYVIVYHRNHLPIMSSVALAEEYGIYHYDFTTGPDKVYGGAKACTEVSSGAWGMIGGDGNADSQVDNIDKNDYWFIQSGGNGYLESDFNMDAQVNDDDITNIWAPNSGSGSQIPE